MTLTRASLFGFRLAADADSAAAAAATSALSAKVGGPEPTPLQADADPALRFRSAPLVPQAEAPAA